MYHDLTKGNISRSLLLFALPMMAGNLLQQFYNIADTLIVGRVLGRDALAAVGSAYTLMTFLTSIFLGLSLGSGALFSIYKGRGDEKTLKSSVFHAFVLIMAVTVVLNILVYLGLDGILAFLKVPEEVWQGMRQYLLIIFAGLIATSLYNFFACLLRAMGNSTVPLVFLAVSTVINIVLDLLFVAVWSMGIGGAALATIIAQYISGLGITVFALRCCPQVIPKKSELKWNGGILKEIVNLSSMTCIQQSVMNFGILMVQGLVNSFGPVVMAAFAAAVKIDSFAYLPVQDFGNAYSTFIAQNYGAGNRERIKKGTKQAFALSILFCIFISALVFIFAGQLMGIFVSKAETEVIACGIKYLRGRRCILLGNWLSVPVLRLLPCCKAGGNVRSPYGYFFRNACTFSLCVVCESRRSRYLGGDPHRLGTGRYYRTGLYVKIETLRHVEKAKSRWFGITEAWLFG